MYNMTKWCTYFSIYLTEVQNIVEKSQQSSWAFPNLCNCGNLLIGEIIINHKNVQQPYNRSHGCPQFMTVLRKKQYFDAQLTVN